LQTTATPPDAAGIKLVAAVETNDGRWVVRHRWYSAAAFFVGDAMADQQLFTLQEIAEHFGLPYKAVVGRIEKSDKATGRLVMGERFIPLFKIGVAWRAYRHHVCGDNGMPPLSVPHNTPPAAPKRRGPGRPPKKRF